MISVIHKFVVLSLCAVAQVAYCGGFYNPWEAVRHPAQGQQRIFGGYNAGCLQGAQAPKETGFGFQFVKLSRNKFWGHSATYEYIERMGQSLRPKNISLLIADISMPRG